jgi:hypothetical protein
MVFPMHMRAIVGISLLALISLLLAPCFCAEEEEEPAQELPSKSPDGKWLVRSPNDAEREKLKEDEAPKLGLYEVSTGRHVACLLLDTFEGFTETLQVVWSKDSTRMAFNFRAGGRYYSTALYELKEGKFIDLPAPEDMLLGFLDQVKAAQIKEMGLKPGVYQRRIHDEITTRRWIDANTVEVDAHSIRTVPVKLKGQAEDEEPEIVDVAAKFRFLLKLDAKKKGWKIVKSEKLKEE